jgi:Holliday junction resolvase RusA-like endonuclease
MVPGDIPDLHGEMWIPFAPVAKGRPRFMKGRVVTPKKTREAEEIIREFVFYHHIIKEPLDYPLAVSIRFFFGGNPKNYHTRKPDVDNLAKLVLDSLGPKVHTYLGVRTLGKGILYNDDCQIVSLMVDKYYHKTQGIWLQWKTMPNMFAVKHPLEKE